MSCERYSSAFRHRFEVRAQSSIPGLVKAGVSMADRDRGAFCSELWFGLGTDLTLFIGSKVHVWTRGATRTVFFFGELGLLTAQRIRTLEFDGWELFEALEDRVIRLADLRAAQDRILEIFLARQAAAHRAVGGVES